MDIPASRLFSQHITQNSRNSVKDLVSYMGAMQAQDPNMIKWAVGVRLPGITEKTVEEAINRGDVVRTHLLRPTWHLVAADDLRWILRLTTPHIKSSMRSRLKQLGLTEDILARSNRIIRKALGDGNHLTRPELTAELQQAGIPTDENRSSHLLMRAELDELICSGPLKGKQTTYALLDERVPSTTVPDREESLAMLASRYFTSHAPATLQDFIWWSGLPVTDAKRAVEIIKPDFVVEKSGEQEYLLPDAFSFKKNHSEPVHALPAFDEFLISYKDRTASLPSEHHHKAVSNNGIFWPVIAVEGKIVGNWKRTVKKDRVHIETHYFESVKKDVRSEVKKAFIRFARFLDKEPGGEF
ncbi:winged helix DNA-binding domain-containing protein [Sinomicrobium weinanense]|uniref:AlkZ family DNA glycosylase n=1 Tax=Sinomicrobium weinanense TaxID=2842200 RepID=A0A926JPG7_9FLAO|nr:winged helix DNA-binding domain-containing protein [Sinomicrobium weinanense]MBC9794913.1 AlkZ family DNA glycosylase [Sinomicrobium weinanense]MBU3125684.1 winged helix DNA-binding domain-containing protein [Sinomicrobium weinanense]